MHKAATLTELSPHKAAAPWLGALQQAALDQVKATGLPTKKDEDWRYSDPKAWREGTFVPAPSPGADETLLQGARLDAAGVELVLVNGRLDRGKSRGLDAAGLSVTSVAEADATLRPVIEQALSSSESARSDAFLGLNRALFDQGLVLHVTASQEAPVHVLHISDARDAAALSSPFVLCAVDQGAQVTLVEQHVSASHDQTFANAAVHVALGAGAQLAHHLWQRLSDTTQLVHTVCADLDAAAQYSLVALHLGAGYARSFVEARLGGEQAEVQYHGLLLGHGQSHQDVHSAFDHRVPHCTSRQMVKSILGGKSHGVFNGKVIFREHAQKSDTAQANHNLLLSRDAEIDTKPELEIYADDVKASHGATVGQLDDEPVFYLRSRGLDEPTARRLLTIAFAQDVLEHIGDEALDAFIHPLIDARLAAMLDEVTA